MSDLEGVLEESERILCSDGNCIGAINEKGVCNICGKPRAKGRTHEGHEGFLVTHASSHTTEASGNILRRTVNCIDEKIFGFIDVLIDKVVKFIKWIFYSVVGLVLLGVVLFLLATFLLVGWKIVKWAWE